MSSEIRITDDADYLLCVLYDEYRNRRKNGASSLDAKVFFDAESIQSNYMPDGATDDIDEAARELSRHDLADCLFADDSLQILALSNEGISLMQHRFSDKLESLSARITFLRSLFFA